MPEEPSIIQMNIDRYRAMLGLRLPDEQRASSNCSMKLLSSLRMRLIRTTNIRPSVRQ